MFWPPNTIQCSQPEHDANLRLNLYCESHQVQRISDLFDSKVSNRIPPNAILIIFFSWKRILYSFSFLSIDSNNKHEPTINDYICNNKNVPYSVDDIGGNAILYNCIFLNILFLLFLLVVLLTPPVVTSISFFDSTYDISNVSRHTTNKLLIESV